MLVKVFQINVEVKTPSIEIEILGTSVSKMYPLRVLINKFA